MWMFKHLVQYHLTHHRIYWHVTRNWKKLNYVVSPALFLEMSSLPISFCICLLEKVLLVWPKFKHNLVEQEPSVYIWFRLKRLGSEERILIYLSKKWNIPSPPFCQTFSSSNQSWWPSLWSAGWWVVANESMVPSGNAPWQLWQPWQPCHPPWPSHDQPVQIKHTGASLGGTTVPKKGLNDF